jgi:Kef-type K+ transport system membrane component KefB
VLVAQDIAVVPMLIFAGAGAGVLADWPLLVTWIGLALVSSLIIPQIGEFSFVLATTGVASGIFISQEADFLLAVIAASLFLSPIGSNALHYPVARSKIYLLG